MKRIRNDILIICCILAVAGLFFLWNSYQQSLTPQLVSVFINGSLFQEYSLDQELTISIPSEDGYNLLVISNDTASVSDADCPDKLCVHQHSISKTGESIICLPHKLVIQIQSSKEESRNDAIAY